MHHSLFIGNASNEDRNHWYQQRARVSKRSATRQLEMWLHGPAAVWVCLSQEKAGGGTLANTVLHMFAFSIQELLAQSI